MKLTAGIILVGLFTQLILWVWVLSAGPWLCLR